MTIRLLPPGPADPPLENAGYEPVEDPVFGPLEPHVDVLTGCVDFAEHAAIGVEELRVSLRGGPPTDLERALLAELRASYAALWPSIATALAAAHPDIAASGDVAAALEPVLGLHLGAHADHPRAFTLAYRFHGDDAGRQYWVLIRDGRVAECCAVD